MREMMSSLEVQKKACEDAILTLMRDENSDHWYVRGVLENLITKIDERLEQSNA